MTRYPRPIIHFTAPQGYINDPNGLYFDKGLYHVFYQWNPTATHHGNTHWGHAVTADFIEYKDLGPAIAPDEETGTIFSGSAFVDRANDSGLKEGDEDPVLLFYTATGKEYLEFERTRTANMPGVRPEFRFTQRLAYSTDGGKTFVKYPEPLIPCIAPSNRDPKVVRNDDSGCYMMALYLDENRFALFSSDDLLHWQKEQEVEMPRSAECPDIFPITLEGTGVRKWILWACPENYIVGHFEGRKFIAETALIPGPTQDKENTEGRRFFHAEAYASQTFHGLSGRVLQMAWIATEFPGADFAGNLSIPYELKLVETVDGPRLTRLPAGEISALWKKETIYAGTFPAELNPPFFAPFSAALQIDMRFTFAESTGGRAAFSVRGTMMVYDHAEKKLYFPTGVYRLPVCGNEVTFSVIADNGSIEFFACGGSFSAAYGTAADPQRRGFRFLELTGAAAEVRVRQM
ncbi:MAG: glycoside hydrolase family 32 protein [Lachnospiraceae bacterium]|nr:glycoside hydrolase family 32 protein [Lachnospiraceae bacterium]